MPRKYKLRYKSKEQKALDRAHWLSEDLILEAEWVTGAATESLQFIFWGAIVTLPAAERVPVTVNGAR